MPPTWLHTSHETSYSIGPGAGRAAAPSASVGVPGTWSLLAGSVWRLRSGMEHHCTRVRGMSNLRERRSASSDESIGCEHGGIPSLHSCHHPPRVVSSHTISTTLNILTPRGAFT